MGHDSSSHLQSLLPTLIGNISFRNDLVDLTERDATVETNTFPRDVSDTLNAVRYFPYMSLLSVAVADRGTNAPKEYKQGGYCNSVALAGVLRLDVILPEVCKVRLPDSRPSLVEAAVGFSLLIPIP